PSMVIGSPTTSPSGRHSRWSWSIAAQSGPCACTSTTASARAPWPNALPTATPMRRAPTSKPSTVPSRRMPGTVRAPGAPGSGMAGVIGHARHVHADPASGTLPARLQRQPEQQFGIGGRGEPAVLAQLVLELAGAPAGAAQRDHRRARALAARQRLEHVARGGHVEAVADRQAGVPAAVAVV